MKESTHVTIPLILTILQSIYEKHGNVIDQTGTPIKDRLVQVIPAYH